MKAGLMAKVIAAIAIDDEQIEEEFGKSISQRYVHKIGLKVSLPSLTWFANKG